MKTCNYLNIFYAAALAVMLNGCTRYPAYEITDVFFLNRTTLNMYLGDTARIIASPDKASYVWSSENEEIATVDRTGLVKAENYGFTSIIVKSGDIEDKVDIQVREYIPLTGITPSVESVRFSPGNTFKLWAYPVPADASEYSFTWRSEDTRIVTVNRSGELYAVSGGETNIVITSGDLEAKVSVTVVDANVVLMDAVGLWLFEDPDNLLKATIGEDLGVKHIKVEESLISYYAVDDPTLKAVTVSQGTYFTARHGIEPDDAEKRYINEYTLMFDFRIREPGLFYSFFQTQTYAAHGDAECMINNSNRIGIGVPGYSVKTVEEYVWYRLVVAVQLPSAYDLFLDGSRIFTASQTQYLSSIGLNSRFALMVPDVLLFSDNDGDDNDIDASAVAIWDRRLTDDEIAILGRANTYEREFD
jgi:hypothetical protein